MNSDDSETTRRRALIGIGTGLAVGLAGCMGGGDGTETEGSTSTEMSTEMETSTEMASETEMETEMETESGDGTGTEGESASVRVAHMAPNAPNVDVYVDGSAVLEDVPFGAVSEYLAVPAGERQVQITAAGDPDTVVFEGAVPVEAGMMYTVAATGEIGDMADQEFEPLVLQGDGSAPGDDMARVRLVHASPDAPAVDVTLASNGDAVFDGVAYGESSTTTVPAGDYTLEVRGDTESNDGDVAASFDVSLSGGQAYTAFAAGYLTPDDEPADTAFDLIVAQDTQGMSG